MYVLETLTGRLIDARRYLMVLNYCKTHGITSAPASGGKRTRRAG